MTIVQGKDDTIAERDQRIATLNQRPRRRVVAALVTLASVGGYLVGVAR